MRMATVPCSLAKWLNIESTDWPDNHTVVEAGNLVHGRHGCVESGTEVAGILPESSWQRSARPQG